MSAEEACLPSAWVGAARPITRADIQEVVNRLVAEGFAATTIETTANAIRAIYRHEIECDRIKTNPTRGMQLPTGGARRERVAPPAEARALIAAVPVE